MNIKVEKRGAIAILSIDRPRAMNALSRAIVDEMDVCIEQIGNDPEIRALIIYSNKNFAAGADIRDMVSCNPEEARNFSFTPTYNKIEKLSVPTIAAIEGYALGGGLELALTCDFRIADEKAIMGFPEIKLGIMPGAGGTIRAPRLIGPAKAKELIFTGSNITAEVAEKIGLINSIAPEGGVLAAAEKLAGKLAKNAPVALRVAKQTIDEGLKEPDILNGTEMECERWCGLFRTQDQKEGMHAFTEKRAPVYVGK